MQGAVTVTLDGGGGAALIAVAADMVLVREVGDGGFIREVGGDGGLVRKVGGDGGFVVGMVLVREIELETYVYGTYFAPEEFLEQDRKMDRDGLSIRLHCSAYHHPFSWMSK